MARTPMEPWLKMLGAAGAMALSNVGGVFLTGVPDAIDWFRRDTPPESLSDLLRRRLPDADDHVDQKTVDLALGFLKDTMTAGDVVRDAIARHEDPSAAAKQIRTSVYNALAPQTWTQATADGDMREKALDLIESAFSRLLANREVLLHLQPEMQREALSKLDRAERERIEARTPTLRVPWRGEYAHAPHDYRARALPLVGRLDELAKLRSFLADEAQGLKWAQVAGVGGQGKSRLALELCIEFSQTWRAGFLPDRELARLDKWDQWQPGAPTLIVVDYVQAHIEELAKMLSALLHRNDLTHPVRVLLVEREPWTGWQTSPNVGAGLQGEDKAIWYRSLIAHDQALGNPDRRGRLVELTDLGEAGLVTIVRDWAGRVAGDCGFDAGTDTEIAAQLRHLDAEGRPLIAYFLAEALAAGETTGGWSRRDLLQHTLERERDKFWKATYPAQTPDIRTNDAAANLAVLATIAGTLDLQGLGGADGALLPDGEAPIAVAATFCGHPTDENAAHDVATIQGLQPDLLGEYFVLHALADPAHGDPKGTYAARRTRLMTAAWQVEPEGTAAFLRRAVQDFPEDATLAALAAVPPAGEAACRTWAEAVINLTYLAGRRDALPLLDALMAEPYRTVQKDFGDIPEIAFVLAKGAFNAVLAYGTHQRWGDLEPVYNDLKATAEHFNNNTDIALVLAKGAFNAVAHYGTHQRWDDLERVYNDLKATAEHFNNNTDIAHELAKGAYNAVLAYGTHQRWDDLERVYNDLKTTATRFNNNTDIADVLAKGAVNAVAHYGTHQRWGDIERVYNDLKATAEHFNDNTDIALVLAQGAFNAVSDYSTHQRWDDLERVHADVRDLVARHNDARIHTEWAKMAAVRAHAYGHTALWESFDAAYRDFAASREALPEKAGELATAIDGMYRVRHGDGGA